MHHSHFILGGLFIMSIIVSGTDGATLYMPTAAYDSILLMSLMGAENHIAASSLLAVPTPIMVSGSFWAEETQSQRHHAMLIVVHEVGCAVNGIKNPVAVCIHPLQAGFLPEKLDVRCKRQPA